MSEPQPKNDFWFYIIASSALVVIYLSMMFSYVKADKRATHYQELWMEAITEIKTDVARLLADKTELEGHLHVICIEHPNSPTCKWLQEVYDERG